jgi:hypothetical protein
MIVNITTPVCPTCRTCLAYQPARPDLGHHDPQLSVLIDLPITSAAAAAAAVRDISHLRSVVLLRCRVVVQLVAHQPSLAHMPCATPGKKTAHQH